MKTNISFFLLFSITMLFSIDINAQFLDKLFNAKYHSGFAILNNGDTIGGSIKFNNDYEDYNAVCIKDTVTGKKKYYKPEQVKFFTFDSLNFHRKFLFNEWKFVCLLMDERLKIYLYRYLAITPYVSWTETAYILEKPNGQYLMVTSHKMFPFKKHAGEFFKDYPELAEKINNKEYRFEHLFVIAMEYNNWLVRKETNSDALKLNP
ncbi:MAG TPA: hypothetical protein VHO72_07940 [Bacteroidales bacterium]|nr:hypothetical protein [Bacteroidales bacterium]